MWKTKTQKSGSRWGRAPQQGLQRPVEALVKGPGGEVAAPVVIVTVSISEEVPADCWELRSCCVQTSMKSLKVVRQSPETSLGRDNRKT